jgi:Flp pilus assembly protein TadG
MSPLQERAHGRKAEVPRERGAALMEFALVLPIIVVLMLGIITGGISLNRSISLNNAAREGARYGATLPIDSDISVWLNAVADVAISAATEDLDDGQPGRRVCVAFVHPAGTDPSDQTTRLVVDTAGEGTITVGASCHPDGRPDDERRVQVSAARTSELEVVFWSRTLTLHSESTARFERAGL